MTKLRERGEAVPIESQPAVKTNKTMTECADLYLEWFNDYLTVEKFAEHKGFSEDEAHLIIMLGRIEHERRVKK